MSTDTQLRLEVGPGPVARRHDRPTAKAAGAAIAADLPRLNAQLRLVLDVMITAGHRGLIDHEVAHHARLPISSAAKRRLDLERLGYAEPTGERRPSPYGVPSAAHRLTVAGMRCAAELQRINRLAAAR